MDEKPAKSLGGILTRYQDRVTAKILAEGRTPEDEERITRENVRAHRERARQLARLAKLPDPFPNGVDDEDGA